MADSFSIRVDGQDEIETTLAGLIGKVDDMAPLMDMIGMVLEVDAQDNFIGEHSPAGVPWPKSQRAKDSGGKTLQDSRRLFLSLTHRSGPTFAEVGTNVVYARRHNQGWSGTEQVASHKRVMREVFGVKLAEPIIATVKAHSRKANTPKREFIGLSAGGREEIAGVTADYLGVDQ
ncbi:MAG: phage virion morphogenesis protein [Sphingobium sp.]